MVASLLTLSVFHSIAICWRDDSTQWRSQDYAEGKGFKYNLNYKFYSFDLVFALTYRMPNVIFFLQ